MTNNFLPFWAIFCPLIILTTWKIKVWKKWKKHLKISSFYTCIPQMMIIWCLVPEIEAQQTNFFVILDHFLSFYATSNSKSQNFEKNEKSTWRYHHIVCTPSLSAGGKGDRTLIFRGKLMRKRGVTFLRGVAIFM